MATVAPSASLAVRCSGVQLMTVTECPFCANDGVGGWLMCPSEPVTTILITIPFLFTKFV